MENIPVCIIEINENGKIVGHNKCFKDDMINLLNEEPNIIGLSIKDVIPEYKNTLYKEPLNMFIKGVKVKCRLSVSSDKQYVYIEIFHCTKRFMDFIGYEFRTPVSAAVEMASLLSISKDSKKQNSYISAIKNNNLKLTRVLVNTIDYLKIVTSNISFKKETCYLEFIFDLIKHKIGQTKSIVNYTIHEDMKIIVDKQRFIEMFIHILMYFIERDSNARVNIKSSFKNGILSIYITDNGKRITDIDNLFSGFLDKDYITETSKLEIPIAKGLAIGIGGDLVLENSSDYGNTFRFFLKVS